MKPQLHHVGESRSPVVVVDDFTGAVDEVVAVAAALGPFPPAERTLYPGLRRKIGAEDGAAYRYAERTLEAAAPVIGGAFDMDGFDWIEASFSMVTAAPDTLAPAQRAPHFDSVDPGLLALLHYLSVPAGTGTAFYRHRTTGTEIVTAANVDAFVAAARKESAGLEGYIDGSNAWFEEIGRIEAVPDRLIIYRGGLLHSGIIPPGMALDPDPRRGRLTANFFVQGR